MRYLHGIKSMCIFFGGEYVNVNNYTNANFAKSIDNRSLTQDRYLHLLVVQYHGYLIYAKCMHMSTTKAQVGAKSKSRKKGICACLVGGVGIKDDSKITLA